MDAKASMIKLDVGEKDIVSSKDIIRSEVSLETVVGAKTQNKLKKNGKNNSNKKKRNPSNTRPATDNQARISFLFQAANTLLLTKYGELSRNMARNADLVSKKSVTKLTPSLKRSICRDCNTCLIPGLSQKTYITNDSVAKSPHNDVLVHECCNCGTKKRFPIGRDLGYTEFAARA